MAEDFAIFEVALDKGALAVSQMPGRAGDFAADVSAIADWGAGLVLSMTPHLELFHGGAKDLPARLAARGIDWAHLPITDFGAPGPASTAKWAGVSAKAHQVLDGGGKVLAHCWGGQGRSGMAVLRLMVERGWEAEAALAEIRKMRPGAVETGEQFDWASDCPKDHSNTDGAHTR